MFNNTGDFWWEKNLIHTLLLVGFMAGRQNMADFKIFYIIIKPDFNMPMYVVLNHNFILN